MVWLLTGFWHGGTLNFLIWGLLLGGMIILEKLIPVRLSEKAPLLGHLKVLFLIPLTWVVFAIPDPLSLTVYFGRLFPFFGIGNTLNPMDYLKNMSMLIPLFAACILLCLPRFYGWIIKKRESFPVCLCMTALFWISVYSAVLQGGQSFMYFSF